MAMTRPLDEVAAGLKIRKIFNCTQIKHRRRKDRGTEGAEFRAPKARGSRHRRRRGGGVGYGGVSGGGVPLPIQLGGLSSIFCDLFQSNVQHIFQWGNVGRKFLKFQFDNLAVAKFTAGCQVVSIIPGDLPTVFWCSMRTWKCVHITCTCQLCI